MMLTALGENVRNVASALLYLATRAFILYHSAN